MNKLAFILSIIFINSVAYGLQINKSEQLTLSLNPTNQETSFSLSYESQDDQIIEKKFEQAIKLSKKSDICSGGKYTIRSYNKVVDKKLKKYFNSYISFNCKFEDETKYELLLDKIKTLNLNLSQNKIDHIPSKESLEISKKRLENKAYTQAKQYKEYLNNTHFKNCKIETITFNNNNHSITPYRAMGVSNTTVTNPINRSYIYKLNVDYSFQCDDL